MRPAEPIASAPESARAAASPTERSGWYPLFLRIAGEDTLVVGGGAIAARKAAELLGFGARVRAVSPSWSPEWLSLVAAHSGALERIERGFRLGDVGDARIVFSATGDAETDAFVLHEARSRRALVNVVDVPERCDFYASANVRRGPVTVAIGTSGSSPALAAAIRDRLELALPAELGALATALAERRAELLAQIPDYRARAAHTGAFVRAAIEALEGGAAADCARDWVERALHCSQCATRTGPCCALSGSDPA